MKVQTGLRTRIINLIKKSPNKSLSISALHKTLKKRFPTLTKKQIKRELTKVHKIDVKRRRDGKNQQYFIVPNKGGNAFRFIGGGENTRKYTGPYRDISKVIERDSKNITKIFGAPHLNAFDVHAGKSSRGKWGRPDLIVALYREVGSPRYFSLHSIEYQKKGGFSPENVAQAYVAGKGATKCWLLFDSRDWPKNSNQRRNNPGAQRVRDFARELGVGLIYYKNLAYGGSWFVLEPANKQKRNTKAKTELKHLFEGERKKRKQEKQHKKIRKSRPKYY